MKKIINNPTKIGLIVIVALTLFFWGLNYLKGKNLLNPSNHYYITYNQVNGLVKSSPVNLDGFQVGLVRSIEYQYDNPGHLVVDIDLDKNLKLPKGTKAIIQSALIGNPTVVLELGNEQSTFLSSGDSLTGVVEVGIMDQLSNGILADVQRLVQRTDSLLAGVETILQNGDLEQTLSSIEKTSNELSVMSVKLNRSMDKLPGILDNVETMTATFTDAGKRIQELDIESINRTLAHFELVSKQLTSTDNSLGLLLNDKVLYQNLSNTASGANELLLDLKTNPKRYVHFSIFGPRVAK